MAVQKNQKTSKELEVQCAKVRWFSVGCPAVHPYQVSPINLWNFQTWISSRIISYNKLILLTVTFLLHRAELGLQSQNVWMQYEYPAPTWNRHCSSHPMIISNKKSELSQRRPRDAPNIWVPLRFLTTPTATFPEICDGLLFRSILRMCLQNLKFVVWWSGYWKGVGTHLHKQTRRLVDSLPKAAGVARA